MESTAVNGIHVKYSKDFRIGYTELWDVISKSGNLNQSHPFCKINEVLQWDEENRSDRLIYLNNRTYVRRFITWEEGKGYSLFIGEEGKEQHYVVWEITPVSANRSRLSITIYPRLFTSLPIFIRHLLHLILVKPQLRKYLFSVVNGFQYYIENSKDVPRNHFGKHRWFS